MSQPTDEHITDAMQTFGGSFVKALGQLYRMADHDNRARLKAAFPHYFAEYAELASMLKAKEKPRPWS